MQDKNLDIKKLRYEKTIMQDKDLDIFRQELQVLLNKHSIDNFCDVPDYILTKHLVKELKNIKIMMQQYNLHIDYKHPGTFLDTKTV